MHVSLLEPPLAACYGDTGHRSYQIRGVGDV